MEIIKGGIKRLRSHSQTRFAYGEDGRLIRWKAVMLGLFRCCIAALSFAVLVATQVVVFHLLAVSFVLHFVAEASGLLLQVLGDMAAVLKKLCSNSVFIVRIMTSEIFGKTVERKDNRAG